MEPKSKKKLLEKQWKGKIKKITKKRQKTLNINLWKHRTGSAFQRPLLDICLFLWSTQKDKQADRQTNKQTDIQTNKPTNKSRASSLISSRLKMRVNKARIYIWKHLKPCFVWARRVVAQIIFIAQDIICWLILIQLFIELSVCSHAMLRKHRFHVNAIRCLGAS